MSITRRVASALASSRGLFLTAVMAGSLCGVAFLGIGETSHTVSAQFRDANGLVVGNEVRVAGVTAGTVKSVHITVDPNTGKQFADVQMTIDPNQWPLRQGTTIAVKPKGVLSNVFVDLQPGPIANPSLGEQPFFALDQTQSPVNLDELSNLFDPSVTASIRTQLQEGVLALGGAGANDLNQTIFYADPLTRDAIPVTEVLATRSPQLDRLNFEFNTISGEIAREDANLRPLIVNLNTLLGALAVSEADLQGTLEHAATVFHQLDTALSGHESDLARFFQMGPQTITCASALSDYFSPLVKAVNPHIISLDVLLGEFVTATGYNSNTQNMNDALRVDATLPPNGTTAKGSGGLGQEHGAGFQEGKQLGFPTSLPAASVGNNCMNAMGLSVPGVTNP